MLATNIIKGHYAELTGKNDKLFADRYAICKSCSEVKTTKIGEVCGLCGCRLQAKLRVEGERCPADKWFAYFED